MDTNLFDVIASLGTGLYVHHIELASFPLCRLNRNLPATVPGRVREGRRECGGGMGLRKTQIKFKMTTKERTREGNKRQSKN